MEIVNNKLKDKIIITGNRGFVGSNLSRYLNNKKVIGVSRNPIKNDISYQDLSNNYLDDKKAFIHLAGMAHDLKNKTSNQDYFRINTELTKKLFNLFLESDCETFIYLSSVKAVKDKVIGIVTEKTTPNPISDYGKSKLAAENYIRKKKLRNGKRIFILRPCMIHGPKNKGNLNLLYKVVSKRIPWILGSYENKRSYCSVDNLSFIIKELIINNKISSGIYNIADDTPLSTNQVVSLISKSRNNKPLILNLSKSLIEIIAKVGDMIFLPLNTTRLEKLTESYVVSNQKIKKAIGKSLPLKSTEGLLLTFKSFQKNKFVK